MRPLRFWWPRSIGNQCLLMLALGLAYGLLWPGSTALLRPLAKVFLQASQIVVMPFLICELVVGFGSLQTGMLRSFARSGLVVLAGLWMAAGMVVIALPQFLPPLVTSQFFHAGLFERPAPVDLLEVYLPDNIFSGLAADNFPAVVLFSAVLGVLLQGLDERRRLLEPLQVIRQLFARLNKLVARIIPYGIFALTALNVAQLDWAQLLRIQGFFQLSLLAFLLLTLLCAGAVLALTPLTPTALWRGVRGPLALTASSANLLIALPLLVTNLRQELLPALDPQQCRPEAADELAPLVSLGFALPSLGQVAALWFIPFAGWYVDQPLQPAQTAQMLLTAIPAAVAGLKAVMRQELQARGLPLDLLQLVYLNGEWLYRFEKVLALEGLVVLAVLVYARAVGALRLRPLRLLGTLLAALLLLGGLGTAARAHLARALEGTYRNDQKLLALRSLGGRPQPAPLRQLSPAPVTLAAILRRGVLRVGVRSDGLPWAYRNSRGELVGYDLDLVDGLARSLGVRLEVRVAGLATLEGWLDSGRIDLAVGGIQTSPQRAVRHQLSQGYQRVHLALVVPDAKVALVQNLRDQPLGRPLLLAVSDPQLLSGDLRDQIRAELVGPGGQLSLQLLPLTEKGQFFSPAGQARFDGLLTTAEGGSTWAVLHPRTSLIAPFEDRLASELVWAIAGDDPALRRYINAWLAREQARGQTEALFAHWVRIAG
ncbi:cation:dicarboxylase symporter family transporter [Synechococcus sp. GreenBA-s]|nr:cation:dicarboxylase symporter family transporter [Synechococcus sp. GreenBA-s]